MLEQAKEEYQRILLANQAEEETLTAKRMEIQKTLEWAELFDTAPREMKQMNLASLIERVTVGRGYKINVQFKLSARQFLEPEMQEALAAASWLNAMPPAMGGFFCCHDMIEATGSRVLYT